MNGAGQKAPHPGHPNVELLGPQGDSDEAAGEVSLLPLQQVLALMQADVQGPSRPLTWVGGRLEGQRHLQLAHREVVAEVVGDRGDGTERVCGDRAVQLGDAAGVQLPTHQLQVAQLPEAVWGVAQRQAGLAAGGGGCSPVVVGGHSLQGTEAEGGRRLV